jgi:hypothetical protein
MRKPVYIHAGAHRTGTSSFQLCLSQNRAALAAAGYDVAFPGRDGVAGGRLRLRLPRPRHGAKRLPHFSAAAREHLDGLSPAPDRGLILSEENIPGPMIHFYDGLFFPAAAKRLRTLVSALDNPPVHVLYVVRSYAEIYVSAYRKRAEDNPVPPFDDLVPRFMAMDRGWPELLVEMRDILRADRITVLPYAGRASCLGLLARLLPDLEVSGLREPQTTMNLSATDTALAALQTRYRAGETLARQDWRSVLKQYENIRQPTGFAAFSEADAKLLDAKYLMDLARIAALPGITFR